MILYLDTHSVVWLYERARERFPRRAQTALDHSRLLICPMVGLELEYLFETDRIAIGADPILTHLRDRIGLTVDDTSFATVAAHARKLKWTRDPFDRLITAAAAINGCALLTKDRTIRDNFPQAVWDD